MSTAQILAILMTPAAGLLIGAALVYVVRRDTAHRHHPGE